LPGGADTRRISDRSFDAALPGRTIVTPLYINYDNYAAIPRSGPDAGFFVMRDPRDIVVSWYFSARYSHPLMGDLSNVRGQLASLPESEGLLYSMRYLNDFGLFSAIRSWARAGEVDPSVKVVRFEDLIGPKQEQLFAEIFEHCDIPIPLPALRRLLDARDFKRLSGRDQGEEDQRAHYRKGIAGDWRSHFDDRLSAELAELTYDLASELGYS